MESLVVPDIGAVITLFFHIINYKVDFPTFGCPTIVILIVSLFLIF